MLLFTKEEKIIFFYFDFRSHFFLASSLSSLHGYTLNFWSTEGLLLPQNCKTSFRLPYMFTCWTGTRHVGSNSYSTNLILFMTLYPAPIKPTNRKIKFVNWACYGTQLAKVNLADDQDGVV
jgi:hypothetical protein